MASDAYTRICGLALTWKRVNEEKMTATSKLVFVDVYVTNASVAERTGMEYPTAMLSKSVNKTNSYIIGEYNLLRRTGTLDPTHFLQFIVTNPVKAYANNR